MVEIGVDGAVIVAGFVAEEYLGVKALPLAIVSLGAIPIVRMVRQIVEEVINDYRVTRVSIDYPELYDLRLN